MRSLYCQASVTSRHMYLDLDEVRNFFCRLTLDIIYIKQPVSNVLVELALSFVSVFEIHKFIFTSLRKLISLQNNKLICSAIIVQINQAYRMKLILTCL